MDATLSATTVNMSSTAAGADTPGYPFCTFTRSRTTRPALAFKSNQRIAMQ